MRVGKSAVFAALLVHQVALALEHAQSNDARREKRQVERDGRIGGFGRGVGPLDVSLGLHPAILADMLPQPPPADLNSLNEQGVPPAAPIDSPPPPRENADQRGPPAEGQGSESEHKAPAQIQAGEDKGHDCTLILLERLNKRCCRLPVLVPQKMIDNCTIRGDVSPEYSKRFKTRRGPRCLYDCAFRDLNLLSEDGALDILQITVQLEAAASEAWKPMIRETILSCNDMIAAKISDENTKILHTLSGQNCSVLPWVMLKCLKKAFFAACPDGEVIKRDNDCNHDLSRLQSCNPFTLTNVSAVKPASRPETPANDAFELLKPQTVNPNASTTAGVFEWKHRQHGGDGYRDRRYDFKRLTTSTQGYGQSEDRAEDRYQSNNRRGDFGQADMESGASDMHQVVRGRLPNNDMRSNDNFEQSHQKMANEGMPAAMADKMSPQAGKPEVDPESTHEDVLQAANFDANRRMDKVEEDDTKEEMIYQPKTTPLYEPVVGPEIPRRFNGE